MPVVVQGEASQRKQGLSWVLKEGSREGHTSKQEGSNISSGLGSRKECAGDHKEPRQKIFDEDQD